MSFKVISPDVVYTNEHVTSNYVYRNTRIDGSNIIPYEESLVFQTSLNVPKTGMMLVGWGGKDA